MKIENFNSEQHLSHEELLTYHQATLSNSEMHRLEIHLVDCELCNDALDGMAHTEENILDKHLSSLKVKIGLNTGNNLSTKQWLAVAASVSLIAILGIIYFSLPEKNTLLAEKAPIQKDVQEPPLETKPTIEIASDTISASLELDFDATSSIDTMIKQEDQIAVAPITQAEPEIVQLDTIGIVNSLANTDNDSTLGRANLTIDEVDTISDTPLLAETATLPEDEEDRAISSRMAASGAVERTENNIAEAKKSLDTDVYVPAEPKQGIRSYNRYLKRKAQYPDAAKENNIEGEVIVTITIDMDGTVAEVEIIQALGFGCDQEAIRLVREGPEWQAATRNGLNVSDKVNITIQFKP